MYLADVCRRRPAEFSRKNSSAHQRRRSRRQVSPPVSGVEVLAANERGGGWCRSGTRRRAGSSARHSAACLRGVCGHGRARVRRRRRVLTHTQAYIYIYKKREIQRGGSWDPEGTRKRSGAIILREIESDRESRDDVDYLSPRLSPSRLFIYRFHSCVKKAPVRPDGRWLFGSNRKWPCPRRARRLATRPSLPFDV